MEQQSNNNFDTLFQKAAEEYPLKTDNNNWDIVAAKLHTATISSTVKNRGKWQYAVLLLLLFSAAGFFAFHFQNNKQSRLNTPDVYTGKVSNSKKVITDNKKIASNKSYQNPSGTNNLKNSSAEQSNDNLLTYNQVNNKHDLLINNKPPNSKMADVLSNEVSVQPQSILQSPASSNTGIINEPDKAVNDGNSIKQNNVNENRSKENDKLSDIKSVKSLHVKLVPQPKAFYGVLFFAPDFSTVKLQHVNNPGYKAGVALGYRISKRLSAELGLQRLHTDFFSDGKYLNTSNLKLKPNTKVLSVDGKSKLTEVPFDIRYNFSKSKEQFFATAGFTVARITHTEKYNYHATKDGASREISRHFGALTGAKFFSDINLSAGYQTKVVGSFSLKVEPYYQLPLKGLGVGSLPVTNFGINVGVIKNLK